LRQWIGIRSVVANVGGGVDIKLYSDNNQSGNWQLLLETQDKGGAHGKNPILEAGHAGIRTDFMDVSFRDYNIQ
jgi:hypothetical protein